MGAVEVKVKVTETRSEACFSAHDRIGACRRPYFLALQALRSLVHTIDTFSDFQISVWVARIKASKARYNTIDLDIRKRTERKVQASINRGYQLLHTLGK